MTRTLHIDPEFKAQIPPLTQDERKQLDELFPSQPKVALF